MAGGTIVLMEQFDPEGALVRIARYGAALVEGVPALYALWAGEFLSGAIPAETEASCRDSAIPPSRHA